MDQWSLPGGGGGGGGGGKDGSDEDEWSGRPEGGCRMRAADSRGGGYETNAIRRVHTPVGPPLG